MDTLVLFWFGVAAGCLLNYYDKSIHPDFGMVIAMITGMAVFNLMHRVVEYFGLIEEVDDWDEEDEEEDEPNDWTIE